MRKKNRTENIKYPDSVYKKMIEEIADYAIFSLNKKGIILNWNKGAENIKGYKSKEIIGKSFKKFYTPNDIKLKVPDILLEKAIKFGRVANEGWRLKKNGDLFWASVVITALHNEKNEVIGFSKITRDLTERKNAEEQIRNSERLLRQVLSSMSEGFFVLDKNYNILVANKAGKKILMSVSKKRLYENSSAMDYIDEGRKESFRLYMDQVFGGKRIVYENSYFLNREIWLQLTYAPVKDKSKTVTGACIIVRDITKQKTAEKKLIHSQGIFKSFMANTPAMIWINDDKNRILYMNNRCRKNQEIYNTIRGKNLFQVINKRSRKEPLLKNDNSTSATGRMVEVIVDGVGTQKEKKIYQVYQFTLNAENDRKLSGNIVLDVTEQKSMEQKMADEKESAKKELVQGILRAQENERHQLAYELHDNVNQILSSAKLMLEAVIDSGQTELGHINLCNNYLQEAITEIRRISHNLSSYVLSDINLDTALQDIVNKINKSGKLHISYERKNYQKQTHKLDEEIQLNILRIVQEQLNNIVKHANAQKAIVQLTVSSKKVSLTIKDNGVGFDTEVKKIGLGLHNISSRAEHCNGIAKLESKKGEGCTLTVFIPLKAKNGAQIKDI